MVTASGHNDAEEDGDAFSIGRIQGGKSHEKSVQSKRIDPVGKMTCGVVILGLWVY